MHGADARIEQRLDGGIGMRGAARVVRVVNDACDAGVDATERRHEIAHVHVVRTIVRPEALVGRRHVVRDQAIRNNLPKRCGPRMPMTVHKSGNKDRAHRVDDLRASGRSKIAADLRDVLSLNVNVSLREVAKGRIHRDDGSTSKQDVVRGIDGHTRGWQHRATILIRRGTLCRAQTATE